MAKIDREPNQVDLTRVQDFRELVSNTKDLWDFNVWLAYQRRLQEVAYGTYFNKMEPTEKADSMMMNLYAAQAEIAELGDEVGWKPWAKTRGWVRREQLISEAVDVLHFLGNLLNHAECTGEELTAAYKAKLIRNLDRQLDGYDANWVEE